MLFSMLAYVCVLSSCALCCALLLHFTFEAHLLLLNISHTLYSICLHCFAFSQCQQSTNCCIHCCARRCRGTLNFFAHYFACIQTNSSLCRSGFCEVCAFNEPGLLIGAINASSKGGDVTRRYDGYTDSKATNDKILKDAFCKGDAYFNTGKSDFVVVVVLCMCLLSVKV